MHEPVGELAVVGQQQQALGVGVEPPDVHQAHGVRADEVPGVLVEVAPGEIGDGGPPVRVGHSGDHAGGLVQHDGEHVGVGDDARAVDADDLGGRVDPHALVGDDGAVDAHAAGGDEPLAGPSGGHPGVGQDLVEALAAGHVRVARPAPGRPGAVDSAVAGGPVQFVRLLQLLQVVLVVELLARQVHRLAVVHHRILPVISFSISPRAEASGR